MITAFDAELIVQALKDDKYTVRYTDKDGNNKVLFEIIRRYGDLKYPIGPGEPIDLFASWMFQEGNYETEYLVDKNFLIKELEESCDMELVDTDLFRNQYDTHQDFFHNFYMYEENEKTREFFKHVSEYYENTELNEAALKYTELTRYFVFRKRENAIQKGGSDINHAFGIADMKGTDNRYSYLSSIHNVLQSHSIIPETSNLKQFASDIGIRMVRDLDLTDSDLKEISENLVIDHEIESGFPDSAESETKVRRRVLDGLCVHILERDCDDSYNVKRTINGKAKKSIVLIQDGDLYKPIYRTGKKTHGLFGSNDQILEQIIRSYGSDP